MKIRIFKQQQEYQPTLKKMEALVEKIIAGEAEEEIWFLEHPPLYTAGTSASDADIIDSQFPIYQVGRGGKHTYHGPGQRVVYFMLNLKKLQGTPDLRKFVHDLEQLVIDSLSELDIKAFRIEGRVGIWVDSRVIASEALAERGNPEKSWIASSQAPRNDPKSVSPSFIMETNLQPKEEKIAAIGIRVRKWVTFHGISININPNLAHFNGIVPCGISDAGVTSLEKLGKNTSMTDFDKIIIEKLNSRLLE
jgi:lipoyl(octanoyl) transferase